MLSFGLELFLHLIVQMLCGRYLACLPAVGRAFSRNPFIS